LGFCYGYFCVTSEPAKVITFGCIETHTNGK